ncbi:hypothetical protein FIBSPDRAFT_951912 [Athelia psychrophila]|uniref:Uncharacterized protein n=1 Tax=Athelia psychrophila TaxID=1759441 RepID=A0A166M6V3_9AGAM|nr:hypothetical protein FIBSPDRAFT_951912 [Fibularhizoctonia sp. CBS 109695]
MTSYNTVLHPTRASNVTNVNGDHLTFHCARDIIILHFHVPGPSTSPDRDRASTGTTGASTGNESGTSLQAAQHADVLINPEAKTREATEVHSCFWRGGWMLEGTLRTQNQAYVELRIDSYEFKSVPKTTDMKPKSKVRFQVQKRTWVRQRGMREGSPTQTNLPAVVHRTRRVDLALALKATLGSERDQQGGRRYETLRFTMRPGYDHILQTRSTLTYHPQSTPLGGAASRVQPSRTLLVCGSVVSVYIQQLAVLRVMLIEPVLDHLVLGVLRVLEAGRAHADLDALVAIISAIAVPLLRLILGIIVKRVMSLNKEGPATARPRSGSACTGWGWGISCLDPELLEIGDDVIFGSRSEIFTTDRINIGTSKVAIENGAMIADHVVLLPGTWVGVRTDYLDGLTCMGNGKLMSLHPIFTRSYPFQIMERPSASTVVPPTPSPRVITPFGRAYYKRQANYFVFPYPLFVAALSTGYWSISAIAAAQLLRQFHIHLARRNFFNEHWYQIGTLYGLITCSFILVLNIQAMDAMLWAILSKWVMQLHLTLCRPLYRGYGNGGILSPLTGSAYRYFRALGANIGNNVALFAGGKTGLMIEPGLVESNKLGDNVSMDDCPVVVHINSRGNFALNHLRISPGCTLFPGSRLLPGASVEDSSTLCEHTLLTSGEIAEASEVYVGWSLANFGSLGGRASTRKPRGLPHRQRLLLARVPSLQHCHEVWACLLQAMHHERTLSLKQKWPVYMAPYIAP